MPKAIKFTSEWTDEFGDFSDIRSWLMAELTKAYFEAITGLKLPIPKVNIRVDNLLRDFILKGGFDIEMPN